MSAGAPAPPSGNEIAIVGMAGRFPGAPDLEQFWRNLRDGIESIRRLTDEELRAAGESPALLARPSYVRAAATLDGIDLFDAPFFGFSPKEAAMLDPQHRLFLECAWEALEHAGYAPASTPGAVGVFAGCGMQAYFAGNLLRNRALMDSTGLFLVRHTGNDKDFLATRVSYCLDLKGPSLSVQTACSTSLVALHLACQSLLNGECDMALAGGVTIEVPHGRGYVYEEDEILSPDGHCRAFDAESRGTVFGSGAGIVVVKRLADALADGDHVHAVIRGSAVNNDGSTKVGYLAPSVDGQAAAIREALSIAGVEPDDIGYVETHGTGTPVGDPIEIAALTQAFREGTDRKGFCAIGSLKPSIGHLDTAAGIASCIKTVLALGHRQIPPSLNFSAPNPVIDFEHSPFYVNSALADWPARDGPRRAGVSSLGVGGTNVHVVLEEAPAAPPSGRSREWQLLQLSARTQASLDAGTAKLAEHLRANPHLSLADVAHTLRVGRQPMRERRVVVCRDPADAVARLETLDAPRVVTQTADAEDRPVAFMFAGGGAQHPGMGSDLYRTEPVFREAVDECLALLREREGVELGAILYPQGGPTAELRTRLERPSLALPALLTTQYALAKLWMAWGVRPAAMIGHSMGEYTAAHLAGVFSLADALALVTFRGRLFERLAPGAMLSVPLAEHELAPLLDADVSIAAVNAPSLCVASGPVCAIEALERTLAAREIEAQRVHISVAAHSAMLEPLLADFAAFLRRIPMRRPAIPFVSNLSGTWIDAADATDPGYWVRHLRGTVRFADGVRTLLTEGERLLLEIGPGRTLATLARLQAGKAARLILTSMRHPDDPDSDIACLLGAVGRAWASGAKVDWTAFRGDEQRLRVPLPTYAFDRQRHWIAADASPAPDAVRATAPPQPVPGGDGELPLDDWFHVPSWTRVPLPPARQVVTDGTTLLFTDAGRLCAGLERRLRAVHPDVVTVREGRTFARLDPATFIVDPASRADHDALIAALVAEGRVPRRIVHAWNLAHVAGTLDTLASDRPRCFDALLHLAQAIGQEDINAPIDLVVLSAGLQRVGSEQGLAPLKALLLGPCRVIPQEFPNVRCRSIDILPPDESREEPFLCRLVAEIDSDGGEASVAHRGQDRWVATLAPVRLPAADPSTLPLRERGVYLITGGLGGIGMAAAEHLAREARARLVLMGRSTLPPREQWAAIRRAPDATSRTARLLRDIERLESLGAEVSVVSVDVTDVARLEQEVARVRAHYGAIHGVLHAAGVLDDALIQLTTAADAERVLAPKVRGTLALDRALGAEPLDFFVLCSSISALAGVPGQVAYTAANAFLDAFAQERSERDGSRTVSVGWSAWREVGMMAAGGPRPTGAEPAVGHPLLGSRLHAAGDEMLFETELGVGSHWLLSEHRIRGGNALIPGTGFLELALAAFGSPTETQAIELRDVAFIAPFVVHGEETRALRVHVQRTGTTAAFAMAGRRAAEGGIEWEEHVVGTAALVEAPGVPPLDLRAVRDRCRTTRRASEALPLANLSFGPRWNALREVRFGEREALAAIVLEPEFAADLEHFALHPAMLDLATGSAQQLIPGVAAAGDFYVPMSYSRVRVLAPLPAVVHSHVRLRDNEFDPREIAAFDVTIADEHGRVLVEIDEYLMRRIDDRQVLSRDAAGREAATRRHAARFEPPPVSEPAARPLRDAIGVEEGIDALRRVLGAGIRPHVIVARRHPEALIADLRAPAVAAPAAPVESAACDAVASALAASDAVARAVVVSRPDRTGAERLVAYYVLADHAHVTVSDLRRHLRGAVADSHLPSAFVELDALPVDAGGTVDRAALPDPFGAADEFAPPRTETELVIAEVWRDVLGIDRVSRHDNFFDIGGHSLLAVRVASRVDKRLGVRLSQAIMVLQTLEQIAAECDRRRAAGASDAAPAVAAAAPERLGRKFLNAIRHTVMQ